MAQPMFSGKPLPEYHEGMLIVKMRSSLRLRATLAAPNERESVLESSELSALSRFERAGLIKQVIPLARPMQEESPIIGSRRAMTTLATSIEGVSPGNINAGVNIIELERDQDVLELQTALANEADVDYVSRVPVRYLVSRTQPKNSGVGIATIPPPASTMWNLAKIRWQEARALPSFQDATNIRVAVLDTGIDSNHPDLQGKVNSYEFEHPDFPNASGEKDIIGHGTHVAGTIAASINKFGINGICQCQLYIWKIFDDRPDFMSCKLGYNYFVDPVMYRRALADCLDQDINVINLSIGGEGKPDPQEQALFDALLANDITIVAAMGNERSQGNPTSYPAAIGGVIAVGATTINDTFANFSNYGNHISISAPGVSIWSTLPTYPGQFGFEAICTGRRPRQGRALQRETDYDAWNGTSMATPHVVGAVALLLANKGKMNAAEVRRQLMKTADKVPGMGDRDFDTNFGAGRLNLLRLLSE
jgi:subtilisin family serine protease